MANGIPDSSPRPTAMAVLGNREFRNSLVTNSLFHLCATLLTVMLACHMYDLRNNALDIAALGVVQVIPTLTVAFHAGDVAGRRPRRGLVVIAFSALAVLTLLLSVLSAADAITVGLILGAGLLSATMRVYENPANIGLEAQVVPVQQILKALPMISTAGRIADMGRPVMMGFIWAYGGPEATYATMAAILAVSAMIMWVRIAPKPVPYTPSKPPPLRRIKEG